MRALITPLRVIVIAAVAPLIGCATAERREIGPEAAPPVRDARAEDQIKAMSDYLAGLERFRFEADISYDEFLVESQKVQIGKRAVVDLVRPNRARGEISGDAENRKYWYDGRQVVILDVDKNVYSSATVPDTIDGMLTTMAEQHGIVLPLAELLSSDPASWLTTHVLTSRYVGMHRAAGVNCHHLAFEQPALQWQIWIEDGPQPLPRKLLVVYTQIDGGPQYEATFTRWDTAPAFAAADLAVNLPPNAERVEFSAPATVVTSGAPPAETAADRQPGQ